MGRTRSRPPRHVREAAKAPNAEGGATGVGSSAAEPLPPAPEVKLSQQQLARKWEMQWRSAAVHGTPYSYGALAADCKAGALSRSPLFPRFACVKSREELRRLGEEEGLQARSRVQVAVEHGVAPEPRGHPITSRLHDCSGSCETAARLLDWDPPLLSRESGLFSTTNFLILGLLAVITFGLVCPAPGEALDGIQIGKFRLPQVAVIVIFIVSGLCLDSISECLQYKALALSIVLVLGVTPLLAYPILHFGQGYVEETLLEGLAVFCVVPTTLSSGVTMVTQAKGNVSLAVLLTTITNLLGVATMPWSVSKIFAAKVPIKPSEMLFELIWLTLVPLIVGMGLREVLPAAKSFAKTNKKVLGLCQNSCILLVVLLMTSSAQPKIISTDSFDLSCALGIAAGIHLVYRIVGYFSATAAVLEPREWVTVVLMSSQKSLPVCVSVMSALPAELRANSGLMIVPCIMAHASQLIIDSILAVRWEVKEEKQAPLLPS
ncbi:BASS4 [Symbiodinium natans]|uniref:BASS4 protein n=1 Tax=Symbiodinium natans TaxID=878477 RepID=A0A812NFJ6_9DINO|nr:BASS4 [Symbiodinium natans]